MFEFNATKADRPPADDRAFVLDSRVDPRAFRIRMEAMRDLLDFIEDKHFATPVPTQPTIGVIDNDVMGRVLRAQRMLVQAKRCPTCKAAEVREVEYDRAEVVDEARVRDRQRR